MRALAKKIYVVFGYFFLLLGGLTLLNVVAALQVGQVLLIQALGYSLMNFVVAYAFFKRESWLLYAFALNFVANVFLIGNILLTTEVSGTSLLVPLAGLAAMGGILWFIYYTKHSLRKTAWSMQTGALFALLWIGTFVPNVLSAL